MNTRKTVYNKLFTEKVELEKHEVELANIADLIKITNDAVTLASDFNKVNSQLIAQAKIAITKADGFKEKVNQINELALPLKKQFADLGLNYLDNADVKKAVDLMKKDFDIAQQAGYIRQIIK